LPAQFLNAVGVESNNGESFALHFS
jgi:hypothetical protein